MARARTRPASQDPRQTELPQSAGGTSDPLVVWRACEYGRSHVGLRTALALAGVRSCAAIEDYTADERATMASARAAFLRDGLALIGIAMELRLYVVERDDELGAAIVDACGKWHARHIAGGEMPDVTSHRDADVLARMFAAKLGEMDDDPAIEALVREHVSLQETIAPLKKQREKIGAMIMQRLGEHEACRGKWGHATWKPEKGRIDWRAAARSYYEGGADEQFEREAEMFRGDGPRKLLTRLAKEKP